MFSFVQHKKVSATKKAKNASTLISYCNIISDRSSQACTSVGVYSNLHISSIQTLTMYQRLVPGALLVVTVVMMGTLLALDTE